MEKTSVTLQDIREAADRIRPHIRHTPLLREKIMDNVLGVSGRISSPRCSK
jgi:threonine dehydratase